MYYDLKDSCNETLLWALDVVIMRKAQYSEFLDWLNSGEDKDRVFFHERIWYENGVTLEDFDAEIASIQNELDSDYRYE